MSDREDFERWAVSEGFDLTEDDVGSVRIAFLAGRKPPEGWKLVPVEPTPEMISAALPALDEYWASNRHKVAAAKEAIRLAFAAAPERE